MANENETWFECRSVWGKKWFLLIKESWKWSKEALDLSPYTVHMFLQQPIGPSLNLFKFESLSVLHSWPLIFALEREHADLPPYRQAIWGECVPFLRFPALDLMRTTPLDYFIRLFFLIIFPFTLCENQQQDFRIKMLTAASEEAVWYQLLRLTVD